MAQRLPVIGGDLNAWGAILNGFLGVSLDGSGNLNTTVGALPLTNVRDPRYGATCDGVTNDSPAVQSAIDASQATGGMGVVYFPPGSVRYLLNTGLTIDVTKAPVMFLGAGKFASILRYAGVGNLFSATGGNAPIQVTFADMTIQLSGAAGVGIDASQFISSTFRSLRIASATGGTNGRGINAKPTNPGWTPFYNVLLDVTFDGLTEGVVLDTATPNAPNRWRIIGCTQLDGASGIKIGTNSTTFVSGTDIIAFTCNEQTGVGITLGAFAERTSLVASRQETSVGGSLFSVDPAANRTVILGYAVHNGAIGLTFPAPGLRTVILGTWDQVQLGNSVNGASDLFTFNQSGANGGLFMGGAVGGDKGVGTINIGGGYYANGSSGVTKVGVTSTFTGMTITNGIITAITT